MTVTGQIQLEVSNEEEVKELARFMKEGLIILANSFQKNGFVRHETYINEEVYYE